MGTYLDEISGAALDLDVRRQREERRHPRYLKQLRPATRSEMERFIESYGATQVVHADDLRHVPVTPVAGGIAFAPKRMTLDMLVEVYERTHKVPRRNMPLYDAVYHRIEGDPAGLREQDLITMIGNCSRSGVRKALVALAFDGKIRVGEERTRRGKGTPRKRYYPSVDVGDTLSLDGHSQKGDFSMYDIIPDPSSPDPGNGS